MASSEVGFPPQSPRRIAVLVVSMVVWGLGPVFRLGVAGWRQPGGACLRQGLAGCTGRQKRYLVITEGIVVITVMGPIGVLILRIYCARAATIADPQGAAWTESNVVVLLVDVSAKSGLAKAQPLHPAYQTLRECARRAVVPVVPVPRPASRPCPFPFEVPVSCFVLQSPSSSSSSSRVSSLLLRFLPCFVLARSCYSTRHAVLIPSFPFPFLASITDSQQIAASLNNPNRRFIPLSTIRNTPSTSHTPKPRPLINANRLSHIHILCPSTDQSDQVLIATQSKSFPDVAFRNCHINQDFRGSQESRLRVHHMLPSLRYYNPTNYHSELLTSFKPRRSPEKV